MTQMNDLEAKIQKMQALLERLVEEFSKLKGYLQPEARRVISAFIVSIEAETKRFLKEARECLHGKH